MKALDVILEKVMEEALEVSLAANLVGIAASKAFRFGSENTHPQGDHRVTNIEGVSTAMASIESEWMDLRCAVLLVNILYDETNYGDDGLHHSPPVTIQYRLNLAFPLRKDQPRAIRILNKFAGFARVLVEKGSLIQSELDVVQDLVRRVIAVIENPPPVTEKPTTQRIGMSVQGG